ncbi:MAG TPA: ABC transporter permease [Burkholderiaceae bacterium]|nr:ABC transporter permease [Burkholderiaceae bacterium]
MIVDLAWKSLRNRRVTVALTVLSIALSVTLLLGVERIRAQARENFTSTISGTDLVVGARTSAVHLLLFSVFRIGDANNNVRWDSYRDIAARPEVAWTIPLSLGDSHRGYRVLGTNADYFTHLRYARDRTLQFAAGGPFAGHTEAVLGADVARALGYGLGQSLVVAHGTGEEAFIEHAAQPFRVSGILARTGTPADRTIHVSLEGLDGLHADRPDKQPVDPLAAAALAARDKHGHAAAASDAPAAGTTEQRTISAFLVGLKSRAAALGAQRAINEFDEEPLTAILPGVTLLEVWDLVGTAERALRAVSLMVVAVGLAGMLIALLTGLNERRREMSVLRSVGARPAHVFGLILGEAGLLTALGLLLGIAGLYAGLWLGGGWLEARYGLAMSLRAPSAFELGVIALIFLCGLLVGTLPALRSYRYSVADGMTVRL